MLASAKGLQTRVDRSNLPITATSGRLPGVAARVHTPDDPLHYRWGREYRTVEELNRIAEQMVGKPVTLFHPPDDQMVAEGANVQVVGQVVEARVDGNELKIEVELDQHGIQATANGIFELSLGYKCRIDGGYQVGTIVDHLAMVRHGRCGGACALRTDCGCDLVERTAPVPVQAPDQGCACKKHAVESDHPEGRMDELQKQLAAALAEVEVQRARANTAVTRADQAENEVKTLKADLGKIEASRDNAVEDAKREKARADAADQKAKDEAAKIRKDADDSLATRVRERVALETHANRVLGAVDKDGKAIDRSALADSAIKAEVVKRVDGLDIPEAKRELPHYLDGMYEGALARFDAAGESKAQVLTTINQNRRDGQPVLTGADAEAAAYERLARRTQDAYLRNDSDDDDGEE